MGSDPINFFETESKLEFMGSDPITKFLRQKNSRVETPGCSFAMLFFYGFGGLCGFSMTEA